MRPPSLAATIAIALALVASLGAQARTACDPNGADAADVANARAAVAANCDCASAANHGAYVSCAAGQANATLANHGCAGPVKRCASRSTCGRPSFATCCRTNRKGVTQCSIKSSAALCKAPKGGSACVGSLPSCCDACQNGGCVVPTTSSTSTSSSTTTSVTNSTCTSTTTFPPCQLFGAVCGGVCPVGQTCEDNGVGGCGCVGPPAPCGGAGPSFCSVGVCPPGQTCTTMSGFCGTIFCQCQ